MKSKLFSAIIILAFSTNSFSQSWITEMQKPSPNFFSIKKKANKYFKDEIRELNYQAKQSKLDPSKADEDEGVEGYLIYKRWEEFWQPRVNADGSFPAPDAAYNNIQAWKNKYNAGKFQSQGNWTAMGPFNPVTGTNLLAGVGRVNGMAVNPLNANEIYACAPAGGIWKSTTGGNNFTTTTDDLASIGFTSIVVDYTNPDIIYAASGEGDGQVLVSYSLGILKSTDGGLTWNPTGLTWQKKNVRQTQKLLMDPVDHNVLLAATNTGIYRTTDAGATWNLALGGQTRDIEYKPGNSNIVYATTDDAFFRSTDNGATWVAISAGLPSAMSINRLTIAVTPANSDYVYAFAGSESNSGFYGMYRSNDAGLTFTLRANSPNIASGDVNGTDPGGYSWYTLVIAADPTNAEHILTGAINVWESFNGGQTYTINALWNSTAFNYVHADIHYLDFTGNTLFCGSDGGLWKSSDFGNSWSDLSGGMEITQFYRLATSEINNGLVFAGAQDNGGFRYNGTWAKVKGGDGMEQGINPVNVNIVYSESQNNGLSRSTNGGNSYTNITNGLSGTADWNTPFLLDNAGVLYVGRQDIFKSTNNGSSYTKLTNGGMGVLKFMAICKTAQSVMYATDGNSVFRINLNNGSVTNITGSLSGTISNVAVSDNDSNKVYVTISGFTNGNKVFVSTVGGLTWTNISGNLPNIPMTCITTQNDSLEGLYLGTDAGVFYRNNSSNDWQLFMNGLPNVIVDELEITYSAGKIRAATYGRGLWESDLYVTSTPVADFTENRTLVCPNQTVTFTDLSTEGPTSRLWTFAGGTPPTSTGNPVTVTYPALGVYDVSLSVSNAAGSGSITKTQHINVSNNQQLLPLLEGFENGTIPVGWNVENISNDPFAWQLANVGSYSASAHSYVCLNYEVDAPGTVVNLFTQNYDLSSLNNLNMAFDVAYARRTPAVNDTLKVDASTDCGDTWVNVYNKGGATLRTTTAYFPNSNFIPTASDWRKEVIPLASFATQPQVIFRFKNISGKGNDIYIDNINIDVAAGINEPGSNNNSVTLTPNPVSNVSTLTVNIAQKNHSNFQLNIYNVVGEKVKTILPSSSFSILTFEIKKSDFNNGLFLYKLMEGNQDIYKGKFIVE